MRRFSGKSNLLFTFRPDEASLHLPGATTLSVAATDVAGPTPPTSSYFCCWVAMQGVHCFCICCRHVGGRNLRFHLRLFRSFFPTQPAIDQFVRMIRGGVPTFFLFFFVAQRCRLRFFFCPHTDPSDRRKHTSSAFPSGVILGPSIVPISSSFSFFCLLVFVGEPIMRLECLL